jgi:secretion/DNA translocation related CpaE-like protein
MELAVSDAAPVLVTGDAVVLSRVQAVTATLGVEPTVVDDPAQVRVVWASATLVMVGCDVAAAVAALRLPPRRELLLVGRDEAPAEACSHSAELGAAVLTLPAGAEALAAALGGHGGRRPGSGRLVAVTGGSGGVGSSTWAAALAVVGARSGERTVLVDLDERSGGLDLLLGAEQVEGWRWPRLAGARGFLGDLHGQLPNTEGVDVLSTARPGAGAGALASEPVRAVLLSLLRSHTLVVADLPRDPSPVAAEALRQADEVLLVVRADVRGIAAGREVARSLARECFSLRVLSRAGRLRGVDPDAVARALALPSAGVVPHDPRLAVAADRGEPPARSHRSPLARSCRTVLDRLPPLEDAA